MDDDEEKTRATAEKTSPIFVREERTTRSFAGAGGAAGGGGADVQARSLHARVAFEDVYKRKENPVFFCDF